MQKPKTIGTVVRSCLVISPTVAAWDVQPLMRGISNLNQNDYGEFREIPVPVSITRKSLYPASKVFCVLYLLVPVPAVVRGPGLGHHIQKMTLERTTPPTPHALLKLTVLTSRTGGVVSTLN